MNTEQFMILTGLKHRTVVSRYVTAGIIRPIKVRGKNDFSHEDVAALNNHLNAGDRREFEKSEFEKIHEFMRATDEKLQILGESYQLLLTRVSKLETSIRRSLSPYRS